MTTSIQEKLDVLIASVRTHPSADLYRRVWGDAAAFEDLPSVSREDLLATPLARRQYKSDIGMVKVVREARGSFLSQWSFEDIALEPYGAMSSRPMVYMSDPHEAIEKSMWSYERGMLPVIGEKDSDMAAFAGTAYRMDSLIADPASVLAIEPHLARWEELASLSIIGSSFDITALKRFQAYAKEVRLVLALPETGAIATASLSSPFTLVPGCVIEQGHSLVVTKVASLSMPVIKYATGIARDPLGL